MLYNKNKIKKKKSNNLKHRFKQNDELKHVQLQCNKPINNTDNKDNNSLQLEGRNAVLEALNNNKEIDKILIKQGQINGTLKVILAKAKEKGLVIQEVSKIRLDEISQSSNHQGIIAMCSSHKYFEVYDILKKAKDKNEDPFLIILDEITDPYNLGAIIRTADACGVHGVIIPKRRAVGLTGVVSKTSSGAVEHVMVARVNNISSIINLLKRQNIWVACADMQGEVFYNASLKGPLAIVIGNEGRGVSKLVRSKCDFSVNIPMKGNISSLNASVAAGVLLYEIVRKRYYS